MSNILKKGLTLLIALAIVGGLAACGGTPKAPADTTAAAGTTAAPAETTEKQAETTAPGKTDAATTAAPTDASSNGDGMSGTIHVYTRDGASGTREAFEDKVGFKGELTNKANEVDSNGAMATAVGKDKQAIGYVSLTTDFEANNLKALNYEGVEATLENVISEKYTLSRPFAFVTRAKGDFGSQDKEDLVKAFLDFLQNSTEGMEVVASAGGIVDESKAKDWEELKANHPIVDKDNSSLEILTVGSTSVEKTISAALKAFQPMAGNFSFKMDQAGSGEGWKGTLGQEKDGAKKGDIGFASRNFKSDTEPLTDAMESGVYCLDAVVAVVEKDNSVDNVTKDTLAQIFKGDITSWDNVK